VPGATGKVTFSLVVTDNLGVQSAPAFITVTLQPAPVALIAANPTDAVEGSAINLTGAGSSSSGNIASFKFSLEPQEPPTT
jgi:hypothetical protein